MNGELVGGVMVTLFGGSYTDWKAYNKTIDYLKAEFNFTEDEAIDFVTDNWSIPYDGEDLNAKVENVINAAMIQKGEQI